MNIDVSNAHCGPRNHILDHARLRVGTSTKCENGVRQRHAATEGGLRPREWTCRLARSCVRTDGPVRSLAGTRASWEPRRAPRSGRAVSSNGEAIVARLLKTPCVASAVAAAPAILAIARRPATRRILLSLDRRRHEQMSRSGSACAWPFLVVLCVRAKEWGPASPAVVTAVRVTASGRVDRRTGSFFN
jgi:hypothetical protein